MLLSGAMYAGPYGCVCDLLPYDICNKHRKGFHFLKFIRSCENFVRPFTHCKIRFKLQLGHQRHFRIRDFLEICLKLLLVSEDHLDTRTGFSFTRTLLGSSGLMEPIPDHNPLMSEVLCCCRYPYSRRHSKTTRTIISTGVRAVLAVKATRG